MKNLLLILAVLTVSNCFSQDSILVKKLGVFTYENGNYNQTHVSCDVYYKSDTNNIYQRGRYISYDSLYPENYNAKLMFLKHLGLPTTEGSDTLIKVIRYQNKAYSGKGIERIRSEHYDPDTKELIRDPWEDLEDFTDAQILTIRLFGLKAIEEFTKEINQ